MRVLHLPPAARTDLRAEEAWSELVDAEADAVHFHAGTGADGAPTLLFPGAFNPLHEGHLRMAALASRRCATRVHFEISVANVDKATLGREDAFARLGQFSARHSVVLTRSPTFLEKSRLFPRATFVVGVDTVMRIAEPRYYTSESACREALRALADAGSRFLVFGRRLGGGPFVTLRAAPLPAMLADLCDEVAEEEFRTDVSSTELREASRDIE